MNPLDPFNLLHLRGVGTLRNHVVQDTIHAPSWDWSA